MTNNANEINVDKLFGEHEHEFTDAERRHFFLLMGGKDSWSDEQKEAFWNKWDEDDMYEARIHGFI